MQGATRVDKIYGTADTANFFRKPYGPGWALVGDAGYHRDPVTAQGINDAFHKTPNDVWLRLMNGSPAAAPSTMR